MITSAYFSYTNIAIFTEVSKREREKKVIVIIKFEK